MVKYTEEQEKAWLESLPRKLIAVKVIAHDKGGKCLLVKPNYRDYWHIPGGGVDANESPINAAIRELIEETGLVANEHDLRLVGVIYNEELDHLTVVYKLTSEIDVDKIVIQESELDAFKMVDPDEVSGYLSERMAVWWEKYRMTNLRYD